MATYLITGCSRGLGLELTRQLSQTQSIGRVIATARQEAPALQEVIKASNGKVVFVPIDISSEESIQNAATQVAGLVDSIDVLINNASNINWMSDNIEKMTDLTSMFQVNVAGAHAMTVAMLPLLQKGKQKKAINMSTSVGSINYAPRYAIMKVPAYKVSKAALNMLTVQWALSYQEEGFTVIAISPGWMRTDLGTQAADLSVEEGATAVLDIVSKSGPQSNGKFFNIRVAGWEQAPGLNQYDGKEVPW